MKITAGTLQTSTQLGGNPLGAGAIRRHPMAVLLFGKRAPKRVDRRKHPKLKKALAVLDQMKDEVAELVGREGKAFRIDLCEGDNASIGRDGRISVGVELLERHQEDHDLLLAVLGHEIGHQPWTWPRSVDLRRLTKKDLDALYREEEAKADRFAGLVLAELGGDPASICDYLSASAEFEDHPPSDYYPAEVRVKMIREAFDRRTRRQRTGAAVLGYDRPKTRALR